MMGDDWTSEDQALEDQMIAAIDAVFGHHQPTVVASCTSYVVVARYIDLDGDERFVVDSHHGQSRSTTLGMLEALAAVERAAIAEHFLHGGDD